MEELGRIHSDDLIVTMTKDAQGEVIVTLQRIVHNDSSDGLNLVSLTTVGEINYNLEV
jgi:hypothetical protein